jgi:hypothetical protein
MGLDSFWMNGEKEATIEGKFDVCGGLISGHGNSSFRGKVYNNVVEAVTGITLYQEEIDPETIEKMATQLSNQKWTPFFGFDHDIGKEEWHDFVQMFKIHAEAGHKLCGWW